MVVTDDRVLFLNRNWMFGACASSLEQAFYLCDLQVGASAFMGISLIIL
jgi:hypothetical protein